MIQLQTMAWSVERLLHKKCLILPLEKHWALHRNEETQLKSSSNQSAQKTQIRTCPRATQQGRIKCRYHVTIPVVPTLEAILNSGRGWIVKKITNNCTLLVKLKVKNTHKHSSYRWKIEWEWAQICTNSTIMMSLYFQIKLMSVELHKHKCLG